jgi:hypothetical protein
MTPDPIDNRLRQCAEDDDAAIARAAPFPNRLGGARFAP